MAGDNHSFHLSSRNLNFFVILNFPQPPLLLLVLQLLIKHPFLKKNWSHWYIKDFFLLRKKFEKSRLTEPIYNGVWLDQKANNAWWKSKQLQQFDNFRKQGFSVLPSAQIEVSLNLFKLLHAQLFLNSLGDFWHSFQFIYNQFLLQH